MANERPTEVPADASFPKKRFCISQHSEPKGHTLQSDNRMLLVALASLWVIAVSLQPAFCQSNDPMKKMDLVGQKQDTTKRVASSEAKMDMGEDEMEIVHPFLTHMGMPDAVGRYTLRLRGVASRDAGLTHGDFGFHLETGLLKRVGLHIRNDEVSAKAHTEIMFQYAAIRICDGMTGLSPFIELEIPTHKGERHTYVLVGFSGMWSTNRFELNQAVEYSPAEDALEGSMSIAGQVGHSFFPVVELIFDGAKGTAPENSMVGGLKYRFNQSTVFGIGYHFPTTKAKEFSHQVMLQTDIEW